MLSFYGGRPAISVRASSLDLSAEGACVVGQGLTIAPQANVKTLDPSRAIYNAGLVNPLDQPQILVDFHLINTNKKPVILDRLQPSCSCTSVAVAPTRGNLVNASMPARSHNSWLLKHGEEIIIHVAVDVKGFSPGQLKKSVYLYCNGDKQPAMELIVAAQLSPAITYSQTVIDFGSVQAGQQKVLPFTVTLDSRLVPGGIFPALISSYKEVEIRPVAFSLGREFHTDKRYRTSKTFELVISPQAPIGGIRGSLSLLPPPTLNHRYAWVFSSTPLSLAGYIQGDASAEPVSLTFSYVDTEHTSKQDIFLHGKDASILSNATVSCPSPWFSAHLPPATDTLNRALSVTVNPRAPAGWLYSDIQVILTNGQRLIIPVSAYVATVAD